MRLNIYFFYVAALLFFNVLYAQNSTENILFIGNSITYYNDMPKLFGDIANSKGKNVAVRVHAPGGSGFVNHVGNPNLYSLLREKEWHAVILQPGSGESAGTTASAATSAQRGRILIDSIRKYSPCAKIMLYQIPYGVPAANNYGTYFMVQNLIKDTVTQIADLLQLPFVPAGESARTHYTAQQDLLLHSTYNDIHPNLNGSYLVAATMFAAIFQETVTGTTALGGLPAATATYFHRIADEVVLPNKASWRINTYNLHAGFQYQVTNNSVTFTNTATNYTALEWDFGDGHTSNEPNPVHTFTTGGPKTVRLKATRNHCSVFSEKQIELGHLSSEDFSIARIRIYPNPATSYLKTDHTRESGIRIVNLLGQEVYRSPNKALQHTLDISGYAKGVYRVITDDRASAAFIKH